MSVYNNWSLSNPPPEGSEDVGAFAYRLYDASRKDMIERKLYDRWKENYRLYRGQHWKTWAEYKCTFNLMFAYRERTVANITGRKPVSEVHTSGELPFPLTPVDDGVNNDQPPVMNVPDGAGGVRQIPLQSSSDLAPKSPVMSDRAMNQKVHNWWKDNELQAILTKAAHVMETYGTCITRFVPKIEKVTFNGQTISRVLPPDIEVVDNYAFGCDPRNFGQPSEGAYCWVCSYWFVDDVKKYWGDAAKKVSADRAYDDTMGTERRFKTPQFKSESGTGGFPSDFSRSSGVTGGLKGGEECLVVELWLRDYTQEAYEVPDGEAPVLDEYGQPVMDVNGEPMMEAKMRQESRDKYPGGIRVITFTNGGRVVLSDVPNPNVNRNVERHLARNTYFYNHFPFAKAVSYLDDQSFWGYSAAEQVGPINIMLDQVVSRIFHYVMLCLAPPMVVPKSADIARSKIANVPNLVLEPATAEAARGLQFMAVPALTPDFWRMLEFIMRAFDQLYAIQDIDRGDAGSVTAASAIQALQERNMVLLRSKVTAMDFLVREWGRWLISYLQMFAWEKEILYVQGRPVEFRGIDHVKLKYNFEVDPGSTFARTTTQLQEDLRKDFQLGIVDRQAVLENSNYPNVKEILARMNPDMVKAALALLTDAGAITPQQAMMALQQFEAQQTGLDYTQNMGQPMDIVANPGMTKAVQQAAVPAGGM